MLRGFCCRPLLGYTILDDSVAAGFLSVPKVCALMDSNLSMLNTSGKSFTSPEEGRSKDATGLGRVFFFKYFLIGPYITVQILAEPSSLRQQTPKVNKKNT